MSEEARRLIAMLIIAGAFILVLGIIAYIFRDVYIPIATITITRG